jgi:alkylhydroperoxidase family enzyme
MAHGSKTPIDEATMTELRRHFKEEQIVELGVYFAIVTGFQKFNNVFRILYQCED